MFHHYSYTALRNRTIVQYITTLNILVAVLLTFQLQANLRRFNDKIGVDDRFSIQEIRVFFYRTKKKKLIQVKFNCQCYSIALCVVTDFVVTTSSFSFSHCLFSTHTKSLLHRLVFEISITFVQNKIHSFIDYKKITLFSLHTYSSFSDGNYAKKTPTTDSNLTKNEFLL